MFSMINRWNKIRRSFGLVNKQILLFGLLLSSLAANAQNGNLVQDGTVHQINFPGNHYLDFTVPQPGNAPYLRLTARGGDGGKSTIQNAVGGTARVGKGGQGSTMSAVFKIGNGTNELKPGSTLRVIVGGKGGDVKNKLLTLNRFGASGGGGTGILYLPAGADLSVPDNWKILVVAGGGGGGSAGTGGGAWDGKPGQTTTNVPMDNDSYQALKINPGSTLPDTYCRDGNGGISYSCDVVNNDEASCYIFGGGGTSHVYKDASTLFGDGNPNSDGLIYSGRGLFTTVLGQTLPLGGRGGNMYETTSCATTGDGGFGCGGGGGGGRACVGVGGGFSGGWGRVTGDLMIATGGGSYINTAFAQSGTGIGIQNGATDSPGNGHVEYQSSATNPVATQGLYFQADKGTQAEVLKTNGWTLKWQYDCNLVLYQNGVAKWASGTNNKATALRFQGDGNLVIYNNGVAVWNSDTPNNHHNGKGGRYLVLTPEGSLFITDQDGKVIWKGH